MKKSILIILFLFITSIVLFSLFCESDLSPAGQGSSPLQTIQTSNPVWTNCMIFNSISPDWGINRIQMITSSTTFGLAVGYDRTYGNDYLLGMILCYSNSSWKVISLPSTPPTAPYSITSLSVINPNLYFIIGNEISSTGQKLGFISQSNGISWNSSTFQTMISSKYEFNDIAMYNSTTGYVIGNDLSSTTYRGFILSGSWNTLESTSLGISYSSYRFNAITLDTSTPIIIGKEFDTSTTFVLIKTSSSSVINSVIPSGSSVNYDLLRLTCTADVIRIIGYKYDKGIPFLLEGTFNSSSGSVNLSETDLSGIINPYSTYFHDISKDEIVGENTITNKGLRIKYNGNWSLSSDFSYPLSTSNSCEMKKIGDSWFYSAVNVTDTGDRYAIIRDSSNKVSGLVKNDVLEYPFPSTSFRWKLNGVDIVSNGDAVVGIGKDLDTNQGLLLSSSGGNWSWNTAQIPDAVTWEPIDINMRSVFGGLTSIVKCSFCGSFVNSGSLLQGFLCTGSSFLTMQNDISLTSLGLSGVNWYLNSVDYASSSNILVVGRNDNLKTGFIAGISGTTWTSLQIPSEVLLYSDWTLKKIRVERKNNSILKLFVIGERNISSIPQGFVLGGTSDTSNTLAVSLQLLEPSVSGTWVLNDLSVVSDKNIRVYFAGNKNNTGLIIKYDESSSNNWSEEIISASYPGNWDFRSIDMYTLSSGYAVGGTIGTSSVPVVVKYNSGNWNDYIPTIQSLADGVGFSGVSFGSDTKGYFVGNKIVGTNNEGVMVFIR